MALLYVGLNLVIDVVYGLIDPRVRLGSTRSSRCRVSAQRPQRGHIRSIVDAPANGEDAPRADLYATSSGCQMCRYSVASVHELPKKN